MSFINTEVLRPLLAARFGNWQPRFPSSEGTIAIFPSAHPDFGEVEVIDDDNEVTLMLGKFTHSHFACDDDALSEHQRAQRIAAEVVAFLDDVFADRIEFYGGCVGGGWRRRDGGKRGSISRLISGTRTYVWSGSSTK